MPVPHVNYLSPQREELHTNCHNPIKSLRHWDTIFTHPLYGREVVLHPGGLEIGISPWYPGAQT